jgi:GH43 family beta-xylosidase
MKFQPFIAAISLVATNAIAEEAKKPEPPPPVGIGRGYYAILPNKLLLASHLQPEWKDAKLSWIKQSGPGEVKIERSNAATTWATARQSGKYVFQLTATLDGKPPIIGSTEVNVYPTGDYRGNPIFPGMFPDPHVMFDEGKFFIYATSMENDAGSYGRASVWQSDDFVNWEMKLTNYPEYGKFGGDIWAPDIIRKGGQYYQFITRSGGYDTWIAVADSPTGPWKNLREDNTPIVSGGGNAGRIVAAYNMDSQPFIDDDDQAYMYWGWSESMAAKLTPDLKNIDGDVHFLKGTKWLPSGGELPQWLSVDLGASMPITKVLSSPEFKHVAYGYKIEVSEDGQTWSLFADRSANRSELPGDGYVDKGNAKGRHVRITFNHCGGHWAGLYNFAVYSGDKIVSLGKPVTASSVRGKGSEPENAVDVSNGPSLADFVEGSYMIKHNGKYYLLYSSGALHDGSYCVRYAMADHPFGPFTTPPNHTILKMNAEQTTRGPGHNSVLKFKGKHYIVYHQHNQPHEGGALVFRQTCADLMEFNADGTIKPVVPTQTGVGPLQKPVQQGKDLAQGCYASATSVKSGFHVPEYALDHNNASLWRAADNSYPQSLTVDLGGIREFSEIRTSFEYPTLSYKYHIEVSEDGVTWKTHSDKRAAFPTAVSPHKDPGKARARFVRITLHGCERPENGAGIYSFEIR